jgi:hypothetical protein
MPIKIAGYRTSQVRHLEKGTVRGTILKLLQLKREYKEVPPESKPLIIASINELRQMIKNATPLSDDEHENNDEEEISPAQLFHAAAHRTAPAHAPRHAISQYRAARSKASTSQRYPRSRRHPRHRSRPLFIYMKIGKSVFLSEF